MCDVGGLVLRKEKEKKEKAVVDALLGGTERTGRAVHTSVSYMHTREVMQDDGVTIKTLVMVSLKKHSDHLSVTG